MRYNLIPAKRYGQEGNRSGTNQQSTTDSRERLLDACNGLAFCQNVESVIVIRNKELLGNTNERVKVMGRHESGEDGISYLSREAERAENDIRSALIRIHRKCIHFILHNGTHTVSLIGIHVVAIAVIEKSPMHAVVVFLSH